MGLIARGCLSRLGYDRQVLEYGVGSGPPSDIWSLGVLTYVLLSGTLPFSGANDQEAMEVWVHVHDTGGAGGENGMDQNQN
jgi:serine/threonine protein kinase|eukprot:SAG25_NODE_2654_length_1468_cov_1.716581_2_plen_81_part_00